MVASFDGNHVTGGAILIQERDLLEDDDVER